MVHGTSVHIMSPDTFQWFNASMPYAIVSIDTTQSIHSIPGLNGETTTGYSDDTPNDISKGAGSVAAALPACQDKLEQLESTLTPHTHGGASTPHKETAETSPDSATMLNIQACSLQMNPYM